MLTDTLQLALLVACVVALLLLVIRKLVLARRRAKQAAALQEAMHTQILEEIAAFQPPPIRIRHGIDLKVFQCRFDPVLDDLSVYTKMALFAPVSANIAVHRGGVLVVYEICAGNLSVQAGGLAVIYGTVIGTVRNNGGEVHVYGNVLGGLEKIAGKSEVHSTARVL